MPRLELPQRKHAGAAVLGVVCVCYGALLLALRQQISTVVAILTEATVAVGAMPALLPFPLLTLAALLGVYAYAAVVGAYLLTAAPTVADVASLEGRCADAIEGIGLGTSPKPQPLPLAPTPTPPKPKPNPNLHPLTLALTRSRFEDALEGAVNATLSPLGHLPSQPLGQPQLDEATVELHGMSNSP